MSTRRHGRRPPTPRRDRHLRAVDEPPRDEGADAFLADVAEALADPEPLALISLASRTIASLDPRNRDPVHDAGPEPATAATFLDTLVGNPTRETTALLHAFAALLPDNYLAQRAHREALRRDHRLPDWLLHLGEAEPDEALLTTEVLGDGDNVVVSMRLPGGHPVTAVVYIDHNLGTVVKDAFLVPDTPELYREHVLALSDDSDGMTVSALDPAEARARIVDGIAVGAALSYRFETDSWPGCRPVVEWMVGRLPATCAGFPRAGWTDEQRWSVVEAFMSSPEAADLTGRDDAAIALDLLRFTTDYSGGDPLRWSLVNVEVLLADWYPQTVAAEEGYLRRMPTVLRALVRYAHRQRDVPASLTRLTLEAVAAWEPVYREVLAHQPPSTASSLARAAGLLGDELMGQWSTDPRELAAHAVGGERALAELDDAPLPDEEFRWDGIPTDVRDRVAEVLRLCDGCAEELFDVELRTAFRRVLARTAATDPAVFRRRSKDNTAAAAIAWAVATVNGRLGLDGGRLTAKDLLAHFGVTGSVSQRAQPFIGAFGADEWQTADRLTFGTPEVLTAERRAELVRVRDDLG